MRKEYQCRDEVTRVYLTETMVTNARSDLNSIINALYWRNRSIAVNIIMPSRSTISSWKSKILHGQPPGWMLAIIMDTPYLLRRYKEVQEWYRSKMHNVHRAL